MSKFKKKSGKTKPQKSKPTETYPIHIVVVDSGDFGYNACGKCGLEVNDWPDTCPHCRASLKGTYTPPYPGGSDF